MQSVTGSSLQHRRRGRADPRHTGLGAVLSADTGMSPTHWLRLRRLNSARRELLSRTASDTTVAQVAMHWSFWHLGRFSSSYRALFQELPSQTLARKYSGGHYESVTVF
nr:helix-turn-helix domain-containing protein [Pseudomonas sp. B21-015]